jgi:DNA gyrase subunit B
VKKGKDEMYIKDEEGLESFLLELGVSGINLVQPDGKKVTGKRLVELTKKMMRFEDILDHIHKRKMDGDLLRAFVSEGGINSQNLKKAKRAVLKKVLAALEKRLKLSTPDMGEIVFDLEEDTEHEGTQVVCKTRKNGTLRQSVFDMNFLTSPEFEELRELNEDLKALGEVDFNFQNGKEKIVLKSFEEIISFLLNRGKKGRNVQRYKGLGEMNPEQLWETTMDPERRTLLQVNIQDFVKSDEIFTILMGDQVEQRRTFIEKHALDVRNLDI